MTFSIVQFKQVGYTTGPGGVTWTVTLPNPTTAGNLLVAGLTVGDSFYGFDSSYSLLINNEPLYVGTKIITKNQNSFVWNANTNSTAFIAEISSSSLTYFNPQYYTNSIAFSGSTAQTQNISASAGMLTLTFFGNGNGSPQITFSSPAPSGTTLVSQDTVLLYDEPASMAITSSYASSGTFMPKINVSTVPSGNSNYGILVFYPSTLHAGNAQVVQQNNQILGYNLNNQAQVKQSDMQLLGYTNNIAQVKQSNMQLLGYTNNIAQLQQSNIQILCYGGITPSSTSKTIMWIST